MTVLKVRKILCQQCWISNGTRRNTTKYMDALDAYLSIYNRCKSLHQHFLLLFFIEQKRKNKNSKQTKTTTNLPSVSRFPSYKYLLFLVLLLLPTFSSSTPPSATIHSIIIICVFFVLWKSKLPLVKKKKKSNNASNNNNSYNKHNQWKWKWSWRQMLQQCIC